MTDQTDKDLANIAAMTDAEFEQYLTAPIEPPKPDSADAPEPAWMSNPWLNESPDDPKYDYRRQAEQDPDEAEPFDFAMLTDEQFAALTRITAGNGSYTDAATVRGLGIAHLLGDR